MSADHLQAPDAPGFKLDPRVIAAFARFSGGYWRGGTARSAWALTLGLAALLVLPCSASLVGCKNDTKPKMKSDKVDPPGQGPTAEGAKAPGLQPKGTGK